MSDVANVLDGVSQAANVLGTALPGAGGTVARIVGLVTGAAAAFAKAGKDPEIEIKRIFSSDPFVKKVHDEWASAIEAKFGKTSNPPKSNSVPPPSDTQPDLSDTVPPADPYES